jgi:hypothetical protein
MAFIFVFVVKPVEKEPFPRWGGFHLYAKVDALKTTAGVFYIDETAWIFDTRKSLAEFGLLIHQAHEHNIQLHSFQLDSAGIQSRVASSPPSDMLVKFLAS